jgi:hypothetical protein
MKMKPNSKLADRSGQLESKASDHPGCADCMSAANPLKPGEVCPTCGDVWPKPTMSAARSGHSADERSQGTLVNTLDSMGQHGIAYIPTEERAIATALADLADELDTYMREAHAKALATATAAAPAVPRISTADRLLDNEWNIEPAEPRGEHPQTDQCGFDRNGSHSAGHYVCECGWETSVEIAAGQINQEPVIKGYWWCPNCKEELGWYHVTHQEKHEACGCDVDLLDSHEGLERELAAALADLANEKREHQITVNDALATHRELAAAKAEIARLEKADWEKGDDGRLHCPCCFAAKIKPVDLPLTEDQIQKIVSATSDLGGATKMAVRMMGDQAIAAITLARKLAELKPDAGA